MGQLLGHASFTSPDDTLILEDESARMPLTGDALKHDSLVTGVVMAVRGTATPGTEGFHVQASSSPPPPPPPPPPCTASRKCLQRRAFTGLQSDLMMSSQGIVSESCQSACLEKLVCARSGCKLNSPTGASQICCTCDGVQVGCHGTPCLRAVSHFKIP